jgi:phosphoglycolate phosphatase
MPTKLLLFDIDGTLLSTAGSGLKSLQAAAVEHFGIAESAVPPFDLAGATDSGVVDRLFADLGVVKTAEAEARYKATYLRHLEATLALKPGHLMPGVRELIERLSGDSGCALGLLTGNYRRGAELKVEAFGLREPFLDGAFGCDASDRNLLGPIAIARMSAVTGQVFAPEDTIIIGDTPRDIACAAACGARCLAVGTGGYVLAELEALRPWRVLADMADVPAVVDLLLS